MPILKYRDPADGLWKPVDMFVQPERAGGAVKVTANQATSASTTPVEPSGMQCTVVSPGNRRYLISVQANFNCNVANDRIALIIKANGTQIEGCVYIHPVVTTLGYNIMALNEPSAGSVVYQWGYYRASGTGTVSHIATTTAVTFMTVQDIGAIA